MTSSSDTKLIKLSPERLAVYSGWEPHNIVRDLGLQSLKQPKCIVIGREPINSSAIFLAGKIVEHRHNGYDRGFTLKSINDEMFKVGGTNTTSSIAAYITFVELDESTDETTEAVIENLRTIDSDSSDFNQILGSLKNAEKHIRKKILPGLLLNSLGREILGGTQLLSHYSNLDQKALDSLTKKYENVKEQIFNLYDKVFNEEIISELCNTASFFPSPQTAIFLTNCLLNQSELVQNSASLSLRSLEFEMAKLDAQSPNTVKVVLDNIVSCLEHSTNSETRTYVAEALGYIGLSDKRLHEALFVKLLSDEDEHVRWASAVALGRRKFPEQSAFVIVDSLRGETHTRTRSAAFFTLGKLLSRLSDNLEISSSGFVLDEKIKDLVISVSEKVNAEDRNGAIFCLGEMPEQTSEITTTLINYLQEENNFATQAHLILSVWKNVKKFGILTSDRTRLSRILEQKLEEVTPTEHPSSSYIDWYNSTSLKLMAILNEFDLASKFAGICARRYHLFPSRSNYFEGLSFRYKAERSLERSDFRSAIAMLDKAEKCFGKVANAPLVSVPGDLTDGAASTALTRSRLSLARSLYLQALVGIKRTPPNVVLEKSEYRDKLQEARKLYALVLRSAEDNYRLSSYRNELEAESNLNQLERSIQLINIVELSLELRNSLINSNNSDTIFQKLQMLDGYLAGISDEKRNEGDEFTSIKKIHTSCSKCFDLVSENSNILFRECSKFLGAIIQDLLKARAVPDLDHRLIGEGRASISLITVRGGAENPELNWKIHTDDTNIAILVSILVVLRSSDEDLFVEIETNQGHQEISKISVSEGHEQIEFILPEWIEGELDVKISLWFGLETFNELVVSKNVLIKKQSVVETSKHRALKEKIAALQLQIDREMLQRKGLLEDQVFDLAQRKATVIKKLTEDQNNLVDELAELGI